MAIKTTKQYFGRAARRIEALAKAVGKEIPSGLRVIAEEMMTDAKASQPGRGVPVDKGTLRASGHVRGPENGVVALIFGGASAPYALIQHERLDFRHTVGEARYLSRAVERWRVNGSAAVRAMQSNADAGVRAASRVA